MLDRRRCLRVLGCTILSGVSMTAPARAAVPGRAWARGLRRRTSLPESTGLADYVEAAAWSPDSTRVAYRNTVGPGGIADARSGAVLTQLPAPNTTVDSTGLCWAPNGRAVWIGGLLKGEPRNLPVLLRVVDAGTGQVMQTVPTPPLAFGGTRTAPFGNAAQQVLYDPARGEALALPLFDPFPGTPAGPPYNGLLRLRPAPDGTLAPLPPLRLPTPLSRGIALQPGGIQMAMPSGGNNFRVFDRTTARVVTEVTAFHEWQQVSRAVADLAYSPDGRLLLACTSGVGGRVGGHAPPPDTLRRKVAGFGVPGYQEQQAIDADLPWIKKVAFHPDGSIFAVGSANTVTLFDREGFAPFARFDAGRAAWTSLAFSPDGSALLAAGADRNLVLEPT